MLHPDKAIEFLMKYSFDYQKELVKIENSLNRPLNYDIYSKTDLPPFSRAAMDGFAYDFLDISERFRITQVIHAGKLPEKAVVQGECAKIMTGGIVPEGTDTVIRKEFAFEENGYMNIVRAEEVQNITKRGEYAKKDGLLLSKCIIGSKEIGILASSGYNEIMLPISPLVGIITTGDELEEPGRTLDYGKIYDSNLFQLSSLLVSCGFRKKLYSRTPDDFYELFETVARALEECDIVLVTGGSSAGEFDFTTRAFIKNGISVRFDSLLIKPGKPTVFGEKGKKFAFGVPGNPVSVLVVFEVIIKPFIYNLMKFTYKPIYLRGLLEKAYVRKNTQRVEFIPVKYDRGLIKNPSYHGSGDIVALGNTNALLRIDDGIESLSAGEEVYVRQI
ncbi:molybdopterin molybdotransferase MoeA [candidate division WOR-3 bacterium]|nr:molybdopterin molybdotransferase MoeA [candidate division WOR-3 bacterium]